MPYVRTKWLGVLTADPTTGLEEGSWWYNSTEKRWKFFDGDQIRELPTRLEEDSASVTVPFGGGDTPVNVTISNLTTIEKIEDIRLSTDPECDPGTPANAIVTGNVVGMTLYGVPAGTTITVNVLASGY